MGYSYDNYPFNGMDEDEYEFYRQEQLLEELHWAEHEQELECKDQAEIDRYWQKLTESGEEQPCGWLKDKYGVSWQIVPIGLNDILQNRDPVKQQRIMKVFLQMKKIDIAALKRAESRK